MPEACVSVDHFAFGPGDGAALRRERQFRFGGKSSARRSGRLSFAKIQSGGKWLICRL